VHHLIHQKEANDNGLIKKQGLTLHKNNKANLMSLCEKCHNEIHNTGKQLKKIRTRKGMMLKDI
jgi:5-methylcytosine-specific restriction endonuclease McrA